MLSVLVGTAGHVDHGKTALIRALTGIDCDRWAEEKRRGITIDLGFASWRVDDLELGFVDVPGHERFLHNALAGLGGIRVLLLVVAADEGVRPQTREHLAIAERLAIPAAVVALTKIDAAPPELADLAELETAELLATTRFSGAPILRVSALAGAGLGELGAALSAAAASVGPSPRAADPLRLPLDRAFVVQGQGVVVTGTLISGTVAPGAALDLLPAGIRVRVRALEVHGRPRDQAVAGERAALQLAGVERSQIARGHELVAPGAWRLSRRLLVRWSSLADAPLELAGPTPIRFHLFAGETLGIARPVGPTIAPGAGGLAEIALAAPIVAARGDRWIARRPSPAATLGGGEVLDPRWPLRRADELARATALAADRRTALLAWVVQAGAAGLEPSALATRLGQDPRAIDRELAALVTSGELVALGAEPRRYLATAAVVALRRGAGEALRRHFAEHPLARGMSRAEAPQRLLPPPARRQAAAWLATLAALGDLELAGDEVRLPGRGHETPEELSPLARDLVARIDAAGLTPPSPAEIGRDLGAKIQVVEGLVRHLVQRGQLVRLPGGLILARAAVDRLAAELRATGWTRFGVAQFKDRFALSRKWAIPLLEHLDNVGVTQRLGDDRRLM